MLLTFGVPQGCVPAAYLQGANDVNNAIDTSTIQSVLGKVFIVSL